jgi:uncharacterized protein YcbX
MNVKMTLSEINIYPIKSLGGISLSASLVEERGLQYDRRWLLVDRDGVFITQREHPEMTLFKLAFTESGFTILHTKSHQQKIIPFQPQTSEKIKVTIWNDTCNAIRVDKKLDLWFSELLSMNCSLVYMPTDEKRLVEKKYYQTDQLVSFADAYPFLIIGQASLDDLNLHLKTPLPMNRFRTNFVFTGGEAFCEDSWTDFQIANVGFRAVKPCARCVITTTNQDTGERSKEPLATLSKYRKFGNAVLFGMNIICKSTGEISVGDKIILKS